MALKGPLDLWAATLTDAKFDRNKKRECVTAAQLQVAGKS